jgi:hypothetical protein
MKAAPFEILLMKIASEERLPVSKTPKVEPSPTLCR